MVKPLQAHKAASSFKIDLVFIQAKTIKLCTIVTHIT